MNPYDRAQALEMAEHEERQRRARLPDLQPVLARDCADCGAPIAPARLKAYPLATRCIGCAEIHETRTRFMGRPRA